ncbi:TPA: HNH endonuclease [Klebsiella oxytoca]|uniref:HNH nuclease domain-containing protein n=1 Tax=Klebsiella pasteurii TaxID=2587529 RepID=A0A9Q9S507_9ENTR|nr:HNH endonuclease signature motif containing protein [Klebsiella pasteurii]VUS32576.1 hypothetical protein SB6410_04865 [Klebsiella pasteurii]VUS69225.1 hypothetical protein SB6409_00790 [Klebsiella pasteurii]HDX8568063.1 HNH endonuclease [Klebsiella oxytoca]HDX8705428.1 HNH endonuclease [Klebsiella oxytoca]
MPESRPAIPEAIKREVRQQCYFGCAICGMPFFQYDHIVEYSEVKEHTAENLVLLCPHHHSMKTTGKLDNEIVVNAKEKPYNAQREITSNLKIDGAKVIDVKVGSSNYKGDFSGERGEVFRAIVVDGQDFLSIFNENGCLSVSVKLTDENAKTILEIDKGELKVWTDSWDFDYTGQEMTVRQSVGNVLLSMILTSSKVYVNKGVFYVSKGNGLIIQKGQINMINNSVVVGVIGDISINGMGGSIGFAYDINNRSLPDWIYE